MNPSIAVIVAAGLTACAILIGSEFVGLGAGIAWTLAASLGAKSAINGD